METVKIMRYKCLNCEAEHGVDNVAPVCCVCFAALKSKLAAMEAALRTHACPDDGSLDTVCYPDNHECPARKLAGKRTALCNTGCGCGETESKSDHIGESNEMVKPAPVAEVSDEVEVVHEWRTRAEQAEADLNRTVYKLDIAIRDRGRAEAALAALKAGAHNCEAWEAQTHLLQASLAGMVRERNDARSDADRRAEVIRALEKDCKLWRERACIIPKVCINCSLGFKTYDAEHAHCEDCL